MKRTLRTGAMALTLLGALGAFANNAIADTYRVTVYNLTKGQIFNPTFVAAHSRRLSVFTAGEAATDELAALAEDADHTGLETELRSAGATVKVRLGVILPGDNAYVDIKTNRRNNRISVLGMLVTTNDAFYALNGVPVPRRSGTYRVPAYDAGSEVNNENCDYIPGPPCNNPNMRPTDNAEGYVHIHNGIHGIGGNGVEPAMHDWHNPVAQITITRVKGRHSNDDDDDDDRDDDD